MKKLGVFLLIVVFVHFASSAHWISGFVEDALDSEISDGKSVVMWNPLVGVGDNLSSVVGSAGYSGVYMMDCEMLGVGCFVNDILSLKIFGERYVSWIVNFTVSGAGYDMPGNLSLNSPSTVDLVSPVDFGFTDSSVDFNCSFFDYDDNVARVSLWGNWSGVFVEEDFIDSGFENEYEVFSDTLVQGSYSWNCYTEDEFGVGGFGLVNNSFFVDTTAPGVWDVSSVDNVCGFGSVPVECSVADNVAVGSVIIRSVSPNDNLENYSASFVSGNIYRANVDLDEVGYWSFECFANDSVGNGNYSSGGLVKVGSGYPEVSFIGEVEFDKDVEVEGEVLNIGVNVTNVGCVGSGNFVVGFFDNGVNFWNETIFIGADGYLEVFANWTVDIGTSEIFVYADLDEELSEDNESNNVVNGSAWLKSWQSIYGNVSLDLVLAGGNDSMGYWGGVESFAGSVFVADFEANIEWNSLQAVGRDKVGGVSSGDFEEIDFLLGMSSFNDSLAALYGSADVLELSVFGMDILNVPFVNSSENFATGVLWDISDSVDLEYDSVEGEDVVFVAKVNVGMEGSYGVYDYEISVPSKLRDYDSGDESNVYLYYDLR